MSAADMKDGGSAFPAIKIVAGDNYNPPKQYHMPGMTLRDYFAAKAMQAAITTSGAPYMHTDRDCAKSVAAMAYDVADAMLAAREVTR